MSDESPRPKSAPSNSPAGIDRSPGRTQIQMHNARDAVAPLTLASIGRHSAPATLILDAEKSVGQLVETLYLGRTRHPTGLHPKKAPLLQLATIEVTRGLVQHISFPASTGSNRVTQFPYPLQQRVQVLRVDFHNSPPKIASGRPMGQIDKCLFFSQLVATGLGWTGTRVSLGVAL